jgi:glycosyltransferase involved in cell wall biosynthesis
VEAMMCDVPVIGSSSGEIPNVVSDAGLIFQEADEYDLKDKLKMIIEDDDLRNTLIKRGSTRASSLYTWESIAKDTYETYLSLQK